MRLLYLNPVSSMGGAERVLLDLLPMVRSARPSWSVGLLAGSDGPLVDEARRLGVQTIVLPFPRELARLGDSGLSNAEALPSAWARFMGRAVGGSVSILNYVRQLRREMARFEPDVVHSNGFKMHLLGACARPVDAALIWHFHDYLGSRPVTCRLIRQFKGRCSAIAAVSNSVAADIRQQLGPAIDIETVWNAVDLAKFRPEGPRLDLDALAGLPPARRGVLRVGLVATFARWKGQLTFLKVLQPLVAAHNVRGYIVGGPVYQTEGSQYSIDELRAEAAHLGIADSVGFTGFVCDPAAALRSLDVAVHASTAPEPFGLIIAEAMAAGRAVVVSDGGGVSELVTPEHDALTHHPGDAQELSRQLQRLIVDPALRRRLGDAARQAALDRFNPTRVSRQMLELYSRFDRAAAA
jgi:glycosyltransferase involved in cell wall biosynthesis